MSRSILHDSNLKTLKNCFLNTDENRVVVFVQHCFPVRTVLRKRDSIPTSVFEILVGDSTASLFPVVFWGDHDPAICTGSFIYIRSLKVIKKSNDSTLNGIAERGATFQIVSPRGLILFDINSYPNIFKTLVAVEDWVRTTTFGALLWSTFISSERNSGSYTLPSSASVPHELYSRIPFSLSLPLSVFDDTQCVPLNSQPQRSPFQPPTLTSRKRKLPTLGLQSHSCDRVESFWFGNCEGIQAIQYLCGCISEPKYGQLFSNQQRFFSKYANELTEPIMLHLRNLLEEFFPSNGSAGLGKSPHSVVLDPTDTQPQSTELSSLDSKDILRFVHDIWVLWLSLVEPSDLMSVLRRGSQSSREPGFAIRPLAALLNPPPSTSDQGGSTAKGLRWIDIMSVPDRLRAVSSCWRSLVCRAVLTQGWLENKRLLKVLWNGMSSILEQRRLMMRSLKAEDMESVMASSDIFVDVLEALRTLMRASWPDPLALLKQETPLMGAGSMCALDSGLVRLLTCESPEPSSNGVGPDGTGHIEHPPDSQKSVFRDIWLEQIHGVCRLIASIVPINTGPAAVDVPNNAPTPDRLPVPPVHHTERESGRSNGSPRLVSGLFSLCVKAEEVLPSPQPPLETLVHLLDCLVCDLIRPAFATILLQSPNYPSLHACRHDGISDTLRGSLGQLVQAWQKLVALIGYRLIMEAERGSLRKTKVNVNNNGSDANVSCSTLSSDRSPHMGSPNPSSDPHQQHVVLSMEYDFQEYQQQHIVYPSSPSKKNDPREIPGQIVLTSSCELAAELSSRILSHALQLWKDFWRTPLGMSIHTERDLFVESLWWLLHRLSAFDIPLSRESEEILSLLAQSSSDSKASLGDGDSVDKARLFQYGLDKLPANLVGECMFISLEHVDRYQDESSNPSGSLVYRAIGRVIHGLTECGVLPPLLFWLPRALDFILKSHPLQIHLDRLLAEHQQLEKRATSIQLKTSPDINVIRMHRSESSILNVMLPQYRGSVSLLCHFTRKSLQQLSKMTSDLVDIEGEPISQSVRDGMCRGIRNLLSVLLSLFAFGYNIRDFFEAKDSEFNNKLDWQGNGHLEVWMKMYHVWLNMEAPDEVVDFLMVFLERINIILPPTTPAMSRESTLGAEDGDVGLQRSGDSTQETVDAISIQKEISVRINFIEKLLVLTCAELSIHCRKDGKSRQLSRLLGLPLSLAVGWTEGISYGLNLNLNTIKKLLDLIKNDILLTIFSCVELDCFNEYVLMDLNINSSSIVRFSDSLGTLSPSPFSRYFCIITEAIFSWTKSCRNTSFLDDSISDLISHLFSVSSFCISRLEKSEGIITCVIGNFVCELIQYILHSDTEKPTSFLEALEIYTKQLFRETAESLPLSLIESFRSCHSPPPNQASAKTPDSIINIPHNFTSALNILKHAPSEDHTAHQPRIAKAEFLKVVGAKEQSPDANIKLKPRQGVVPLTYTSIDRSDMQPQSQTQESITQSQFSQFMYPSIMNGVHEIGDDSEKHISHIGLGSQESDAVVSAIVNRVVELNTREVVVSDRTERDKDPSSGSDGFLGSNKHGLVPGEGAGADGLSFLETSRLHIQANGLTSAMRFSGNDSRANETLLDPLTVTTQTGTRSGDLVLNATDRVIVGSGVVESANLKNDSDGCMYVGDSNIEGTEYPPHVYISSMNSINYHLNEAQKHLRRLVSALEATKMPQHCHLPLSLPAASTGDCMVESVDSDSCQVEQVGDNLLSRKKRKLCNHPNLADKPDLIYNDNANGVILSHDTVLQIHGLLGDALHVQLMMYGDPCHG